MSASAAQLPLTGNCGVFYGKIFQHKDTNKMNRIVYINGEYLPEQDAKISVFDRGFLFADGVYEVTAILNGRLVDNEHHLRRLRRSLRELNMASPAENGAIENIQLELIQRNKVDEGVVYIQITRGSADRDFCYPKDSQPSLVLFTQTKKILSSPTAESGIKIISTPDLRWARRDIKTISLLAASMAKMDAISQGADDAWLVDQEGKITEGSSFNTYIVTQEGIITRHLNNDILSGITRKAVLQLAEHKKLMVFERPFTVTEAYQAQEAFVTSASLFVQPVIKINNEIIGDGTPGPITKTLRELYISMALQQVSGG